MQEEIKILKVRFNKTTLKEATQKTIEWSKGSKQKYVTTPNPEFLLEAQKNHKFRKILNKSNLNIADGIGILWASRYLHSTKDTKSIIVKGIKTFISFLSIIIYPKYVKKILPERVTGTDLMQSICKEAAENDLKIFLLGAAEGVAETTKRNLDNKHTGIKIVGTYAGSPSTEEEKDIIFFNYQTT